ncbi:MAG TPA: alpha/beta fold hydrolase [Ilumatobacter sp.]
MIDRAAPTVLPGCEARSHVADSPTGVLVLHGFTGTPLSVGGVADAMISAGFHVELPRLPGHGTTIDDLVSTRWADWSGEVAAALDALRGRAERIVVVGQSMGGALALWSALEHPGVAGLVCINPVTRNRHPDELAMIDDFIADGMLVVPGEGSDIADPDSDDVTYPGTPLEPLRSLFCDGVGPIAGRYGELDMPLRLFTSRQDHVVDPADSEHLAATHGGPVEHSWLERSYHVATRDFEREFVFAESVAFVERVAG